MFASPLITRASLGFGLALALIHNPLAAQITPSISLGHGSNHPNNTGTLVNSQGNQINISGGTQAGANLFHSFQDFNVNSNQVANFLSNPQTQNILGRINGGNPSFINGLLQVTGGNSNLFLMNPAGIIFGQGASLNVPASFTATTTANGIGFGNGVFNAFGDNNFSALLGNPDSFLFTTTQAGSIVNAGNLAVSNGQNLSLIAGNTLNTGNLTASGGEIQLLAVPGTNRVRLSQPGQVLSLEFVPPVSNEFRAVDLPALLTGSNLPGISVNPSGQVQVAGTSLPNQQGVAVASGRIDVSSAIGNGGVVQVMGDRVAALNARINANGATGGGTVRLGGEYLGGINTGIAPALRFNSQRTVVDANSLIRANATSIGEGGRVIVWADQGTGFWGRITGRGATGRGGFVEVSGRESLAFDGKVEVSGANGLFGNLLLDPTNITFIFPGIGTGDALAAGGIIGVGALPANMTISFAAISGIPVATTVDIRASGNIDFAMPTLGIINFSGPGAPVSFTASTITASAAVTLVSSGRNVTIVADSINASNLSLNTTTATSGGSLQITANTGNLRLGMLTTAPPTSGNGGAISLNAPNGNITVNSINSQGAVVGNNSGAINLVAGNLVQVTGTCFVGISICSSGQAGAGDGAITINHNGGIVTPFTIGDAAINGTAGAIDAGPSGNISTVIGAIPIPPNTFDSYTYNVGVIDIITNLPPAPPVVEPSINPELFPLLRNPPAPPTPDPVIVGTPPAPEPIPEPIPIVEVPTPSPSPIPAPTPLVAPITYSQPRAKSHSHHYSQPYS
ncbi:MAG: filamentous hemagglutinin N-terminal domain-containing protein [Coleofasciculaceae cyanobacterium SM2_1_6]|nr:filamentous hemagglutinin N-terminal domain-containing protein [Coleofasciculaceae cyanobacterium SM2_1_6]